MARILAITANPKEESGSVSKRMLHTFLNTYTEKHPADQVEVLDLYKEKLHQLNEQYIGVMYRQVDAAKAGKEAQALLKQSDALINKIKRADKIVIAIPMWNFSVPPVFKMFIDLVIYPGKTFAFKGPGQYEGLLKDRKVLVLGARGGVYKEEPYKAYDLEEPWIRNVFAFMGVVDFQAIWTEGTNYFQGKDLEKTISDATNNVIRQAEVF